MEGAIYGSVSPADYVGLAGWWRATDGITFSTGNRVSQWNDISGNNRHFTAMNSSYAPITTYGNLVQTANGLGILGGDGNGLLGVLNDYAFKAMLYDGRKMGITIIYRLSALNGAGFNFLRTSGNDYVAANAGYFNIGVPANTAQTSRTVNGATTISNSDIVNAYPSAVFPQSHIFSVIDYGYDSASANLHRKSVLDNVVRTERKFSSAPTSVFTNTPIGVQFGGSTNPATVYEIILFDHTGKTISQIDFEYQTLYTNYILPRYPNLFT